MTTISLNRQDRVALVRRLACFEAPWRPPRWNYASAPAIAAARAGGGRFGWQVGTDGAGWKRDQRVRDRLIAAGCLTPGAADLTPAGKRLARQWTWPWKLRELTEALKKIRSHTRSRDVLNGAELVPETFITGVAWNGVNSAPFASLQMLLVPAIADGFVFCGSTSQAHAYYGLSSTATPTAIVRAVIGGATNLDFALHKIYCETYRAAWAAILADETRYPEIGEPPLPSAALESGRDQNDLSGIDPLFVEEPAVFTPPSGDASDE